MQKLVLIGPSCGVRNFIEERGSGQHLRQQPVWVERDGLHQLVELLGGHHGRRVLGLRRRILAGRILPLLRILALLWRILTLLWILTLLRILALLRVLALCRRVLALLWILPLWRSLTLRRILALLWRR
jgi:hypothetical protein